MRNVLLGGIGALGLVLPAAPAASLARAATRTTTVRPGEDCAAIVRRVYGSAPGAMARFHAANPQLGGLPHVLRPGDVVSTPLLPRRETPRPAAVASAPAEPVRLGHVGPGVRTRGPGEGWTEALPDQLLPRRTRIQASAQGGVEVKLTEQLRLSLLPGGELVLAAPPTARRPAVVELYDGTLLATVPRGAEMLVQTPAGPVQLLGDARIEALGTEARVAVYERGARVGAREASIPPGSGVLMRRGERPQPAPLLPAPAWPDERPLLGLAVQPLAEGAARPAARLPLAFSEVAGAVRYLVEVARDHRFNDRRAGGELGSPPLITALPAGSYHARVSAVSRAGFVGPPSPVRFVEVVELRSDAEAAPGAGPLTLTRVGPLVATVPATGRPLAAMLDGGAPRDCSAGCSFRVDAGVHRLALRLGEARAEVLLRAAPPPGRALGAVEPPEGPVPLWTPGFPARGLHPRSRAWLLFSFGTALPGRRVDTYRVDLGGELALFSRRFSIDLNLPLLYHDSGPTGGLAAGDLSLGFRGLALSVLDGRLGLGPLLRLQVPTGSFNRVQEPGARPVVVDPTLGLSALVGPVGLLTTQGPTAVLNLPAARLRWSMSYVAEVRFWCLQLAAALDAALGMIEGSGSGASLGGGARLRVGPVRLLGFARGGLGEGGAALFGRYQVGFGVEWAR